MLFAGNDTKTSLTDTHFSKNPYFRLPTLWSLFFVVLQFSFQLETYSDQHELPGTHVWTTLWQVAFLLVPILEQFQYEVAIHQQLVAGLIVLLPRRYTTIFVLIIPFLI